MARRDFIGRGWAWPIQFDARTGGVAKDQGESTEQQLTRVRNAIFILLRFKRGSIFFMRKLGSRLRDLLFSMNTSNLTERIRFEVFKAIDEEGFGERRAVITKLEVGEPYRLSNVQSPIADVELEFVLRQSNVEGNMSYPYYLKGQERVAAEQGLKE